MVALRLEVSALTWALELAVEVFVVSRKGRIFKTELF